MSYYLPLFLYFRLFKASVEINKCPINNCWLLDSNREPLVSGATALPTEPQPLPIYKKPSFSFAFERVRLVVSTLAFYFSGPNSKLAPLRSLFSVKCGF